MLHTISIFILIVWNLQGKQRGEECPPLTWLPYVRYYEFQQGGWRINIFTACGNQNENNFAVVVVKQTQK